MKANGIQKIFSANAYQAIYIVMPLNTKNKCTMAPIFKQRR